LRGIQESEESLGVCNGAGRRCGRGGSEEIPFFKKKEQLIKRRVEIPIENL
jgi:hypothetical protein